MVDGNFSGCLYSTSTSTSSSSIIKTISPTRLVANGLLSTSTPNVYYTSFLLPLNENSSHALTTEVYTNCSTYNGTTESTFSGPSSPFPGKIVVIPLYTLIFFLSIIGNSLVIFTLAWNRRMRTVTNVFLLNLAISDLLLGVFCMPVTLIGQILRNFVFGHIMCKIIPYFQAVSVSVGVWTLVAISLERYFAICRPLQSRKWQTRSHAYKMILAVWIFTLSWNIPITFVSELKSIQNTGRYKCRENWPNTWSEKTFNLFLDFLLLVCPLCIMAMAYSLIISKLWKGLKNEIHQSRSFHQQGLHGTKYPKYPEENSLELSSHSHHSKCKISGPNGGTSVGGVKGTSLRLSTSRDGMSNEIVTLRGGKGVVVRWKKKEVPEVSDCSNSLKNPSGVCDQASHSASHSTSSSFHCQSHGTNIRGCSNYRHHHQSRQLSVPHNHAHHPGGRQPASKSLKDKGHKFSRAIRSTYTGKSIESKKKVIRMLFVLVAEFFVCWTPLYVMNTWYLFDREAVYNTMGPLGVTLVQLLAYVSSCCNPITYCFMNRKFRQAFLKVFQCGILRAVTAKAGPPSVVRSSDLSLANDSLILGVPASAFNKSEVLALEYEDRV